MAHKLAPDIVEILFVTDFGEDQNGIYLDYEFRLELSFYFSIWHEKGTKLNWLREPDLN